MFIIKCIDNWWKSHLILSTILFRASFLHTWLGDLSPSCGYSGNCPTLSPLHAVYLSPIHITTTFPVIPRVWIRSYSRVCWTRCSWHHTEYIFFQGFFLRVCELTQVCTVRCPHLECGHKVQMHKCIYIKYIVLCSLNCYIIHRITS